ncbi:conserved hypothetical protein [Culex quinquefasciatus]|uniref:Ig-like domain-containing protein n=1 Tax=Culex quinquefasciatus TaxID=7176 RepID=B0X841_CULQU|nr:conserved hypothetical protein [Culex quinquefasciatus]|eukprot:XP_001865813.1 conserved hypothetical protein [Culex quinquefasciatus]
MDGTAGHRCEHPPGFGRAQKLTNQQHGGESRPRSVMALPKCPVMAMIYSSGGGGRAAVTGPDFQPPAGENEPNVSWYQNSFPIQPTDRRTMSSRGNRHTLTIRHVQQEDFGNYSCVADNTLGRSKKYMEVSGRPGPAEFVSTPWSRLPDSYNLTWKVESYPPLLEVRLLYRKLMMNETFQQPGRWHDVILTPSPRPLSEPLTHVMAFTLRGLLPASVYEAIVQAKNRYGWNEVSDIFQFYTQRISSDLHSEEMQVASSTSRSGATSLHRRPSSAITAWPCLLVLTAAATVLSRRLLPSGGLQRNL